MLTKIHKNNNLKDSYILSLLKTENNRLKDVKQQY